MTGFVKVLHGSLAVLLIAVLFLAGAFQPAWSASNRKIVVNVPALKLYLYEGDQVIRTYPVGLGMSRFPTPEGQFEVINKVIDPIWENPFHNPGGRAATRSGRRNPLQTRWIGFLEADGGEYGIHGTNEPGSVGRYSSHGCIRMQVADSEELFNMVDFGTPVDVVYELVEVEQTGEDEIQVKMYPDIFRRGFPGLGSVLGKIRGKYPNAQVDAQKLGDALKRRAKQPAMVAKNVPTAKDGKNDTMIFKVRITN